MSASAAARSEAWVDTDAESLLGVDERCACPIVAMEMATTRTWRIRDRSRRRTRIELFRELFHANSMGISRVLFPTFQMSDSRFENRSKSQSERRVQRGAHFSAAKGRILWLDALALDTS